MLELGIKHRRFETNYSNCTVRSSQNTCSRSGGAHEKGKTGWNSVYHQNWWFSEFHPHWMLMYFFAGFFLISTCVWPNSGFRCCVFLPSRITLLSDYVYCSSFRFGNQRERPLEELEMAWIIQLEYVLDEKIRSVVLLFVAMFESYNWEIFWSFVLWTLWWILCA
jgi:hypothetical protein